MITIYAFWSYLELSWNPFVRSNLLFDQIYCSDCSDRPHCYIQAINRYYLEVFMQGKKFESFFKCEYQSMRSRLHSD